MINTEEENLCSGPDRNLVDRIYELLYLGMGVVLRKRDAIRHIPCPVGTAWETVMSLMKSKIHKRKHMKKEMVG